MPKLLTLGICLLMLLSSIQASLVQAASAGSYDEKALKWVLESKMIVENPADPIYNQTNPPQGGVFFAYDIDKGQFQQKLHIPSAAEYVRLTSDLVASGNQGAKYRLKMVSDFLLSSIEDVQLESGKITVVAPIWLYKASKGWIPITEEFYTRDMLQVAQALLQAYKATGSAGYLSRAKDLLNTVVKLQDLIKEKVQQGLLPEWVSGSIPWIVYNYNSSVNYELTFRDLDLSLTDVGWGALTLGYNIAGDEKYLKCRDEYFDFVLGTYQRNNATVTYPYQFISDRENGALNFANYDSVQREWGFDKPFTADLAMHQVEGLLMNQNKTKDLGQQFLQHISKLQVGYMFADSYYPTTSTPLDYGNASIVTAEYLFANKLAGTSVDEKTIVNVLSNLQLYDSTTAGQNIYNGAWEWSPGTHLVESMATIVIYHDLFLNPSMVPQTTPPASSYSVYIYTGVTAVTITVAVVAIILMIKKTKK